MNTARRRILAVVGLLIIATILFPPFRLTLESGDYNYGYALLFDPPNDVAPARVDVPMVLLEWLGIMILSGIALLMVKPGEKK